MATDNKHVGLAEALAAFQGEEGLTFAKTKTATVQTKTGGSYTYSYADLGDILPVVRPLLAKHGLSWSAMPSRAEDGELALRYRLLHASGEAEQAEMPLGVDKGCKPQELGSAITYARRYALTAQLNLATDEDDDAQAAQRANEPTAPRPVSQTSGNGASERPASAKQRGLIAARAREAGLDAATLASAILAAAGQPSREFEGEQAQAFVNRQLDRLPARLVDAVLEQIDGAQVPF